MHWGQMHLMAAPPWRWQQERVSLGGCFLWGAETGWGSLAMDIYVASLLAPLGQLTPTPVPIWLAGEAKGQQRAGSPLQLLPGVSRL